MSRTNLQTAALLDRARAAFDVVAAQLVEDPDVYETDVEVLFAVAVSMVGAYADALDEPIPFVLQALEENLS